MDKLRIWSIANLLRRGTLSRKHTLYAIEELQRKCHVYGKGCIKHGRNSEGEVYISVADWAESVISNDCILPVEVPKTFNNFSYTKVMKNVNSWKDPSIYLTEIHVEESCLELEYTQQIIKRANLPYKIVADRGDPRGIDGEYPDNLIQGKHHLLLSKNRGHFFKPCPGTKEYRCCDYQVLNIGMGCPMDCVYCILQAYLNKPWLTFL